MGSKGWEIEWLTTKRKEARDAAYARMQELIAEGREREAWTSDFTYVKLRNEELLLENQLIQATADQRAWASRSAAHRELGRQYGKQSEVIHQLRASIALMRENHRKYAWRRGTKAAYKLFCHECIKPITPEGTCPHVTELLSDMAHGSESH